MAPQTVTKPLVTVPPPQVHHTTCWEEEGRASNAGESVAKEMKGYEGKGEELEREKCRREGRRTREMGGKGKCRKGNKRLRREGERVREREREM